MAHAYTTNRGKTKKAKMGIRKDAKQNAESGLKQATAVTNLASALFSDAPLERLLALGTKSGAAATATKARLQERLALQQQQKQASTCSNAECPMLAAAAVAAESATAAEPSVFVLSDCARCKQARYCSKACQVAHWPAHKLECKNSADEAARVLAALRISQLASAPTNNADHSYDAR